MINWEWKSKYWSWTYLRGCAGKGWRFLTFCGRRFDIWLLFFFKIKVALFEIKIVHFLKLKLDFLILGALFKDIGNFLSSWYFFQAFTIFWSRGNFLWFGCCILTLAVVLFEIIYFQRSRFLRFSRFRPTPQKFKPTTTFWWSLEF